MPPIESRVVANGLEFALYEWPGDGPTLFFAHATGFHARCWDQVVANLPGFRCYAMDMRGHGRSEKPPPPYPWRNFGVDVAEVARAIGLTDAIGVGHSKGGYAVTLAADLAPGAFRKLLLVDPVILQKEAYLERRDGEEHFAARRKNHWRSSEEMFERFQERPPFDAWDPAVLRDYCNFGLLPSPDGHGYVLACPPAIEAATYAGSAGQDIYAEIARLEIPVRVLRAKPATEFARDMSGSPTAPDLAAHFKRGEDVFAPQYSHFMPMEAPAFVAAHVRELAGSWGGPTRTG